MQKPILNRGYGIINTSARIDEAAQGYERLVEQIIISAEIESAMKKLLDDIEKTKRRVNALEFKVIPEQLDVLNYKAGATADTVTWRTPSIPMVPVTPKP